MSRRLLPLVLVLAAATHLCAQNVPAKFRVSGKVVNAVNGHPLTGAEIWFGKAENFEATQQKLLTGDDGVFAFNVAEPGKYLLGGQANGFRRQGFEQHGMYVSAVVVGAGLSTDHVVFRLRPDARVLGVIQDDEHEPVSGATVYLFRTDASFGLSQTYLSEQTVSDDRGRYRLAHLEPGCYYLVVSAFPWFSGLLQSGTIPAGATTSYGQLAANLGRPRASRAVGLANGSNPIAIVVPCHRVIGADGSLTGYGGGMERKRWLLLHEHALDNPI